MPHLPKRARADNMLYPVLYEYGPTMVRSTVAGRPSVARVCTLLSCLQLATRTTGGQFEQFKVRPFVLERFHSLAAEQQANKNTF